MTDVTTQREATSLVTGDGQDKLTISFTKTHVDSAHKLAAAIGGVAFVASIELLGFFYASPKGLDAIMYAAFGLPIFFGVLWWAWYRASHGIDNN